VHEGASLISLQEEIQELTKETEGGRLN
jgi:hypothetical protein